MALEARMSRPGIRVKTEMRLKQMALMSTRPRSKPMRNCINIMAAKPETVVKLLEAMAGMAAARAEMQALRSLSVCCRSSRKRWSKIMA